MQMRAGSGPILASSGGLFRSDCPVFVSRGATLPLTGLKSFNAGWHKLPRMRARS